MVLVYNSDDQESNYLGQPAFLKSPVIVPPVICSDGPSTSKLTLDRSPSPVATLSSFTSTSTEEEAEGDYFFDERKPLFEEEEEEPTTPRRRNVPSWLIGTETERSYDALSTPSSTSSSIDRRKGKERVLSHRRSQSLSAPSHPLSAVFEPLQPLSFSPPPPPRSRVPRTASMPTITPKRSSPTKHMRRRSLQLSLPTLPPLPFMSASHALKDFVLLFLPDFPNLPDFTDDFPCEGPRRLSHGLSSTASLPPPPVPPAKPRRKVPMLVQMSTFSPLPTSTSSDTVGLFTRRPIRVLQNGRGMTMLVLEMQMVRKGKIVAPLKGRAITVRARGDSTRRESLLREQL
ncbi:hypothetical protein BT69DRAFT_1275725 [Atractiella rhizophila]|nr:hypothetical protein BT69DRAFT_1275725 [Atractiella rhizophila]